MIYLHIFYEFFKIGLFSVGGGLATLPFLMELSKTTHWFSYTDLTNMIAISESTPGPIGINMATFTGYHTAGFGGSLIATFALVLPSFIIILIISRMLNKFRNSKLVDGAFFGIRPASAALISAALLNLILIVVCPEAESIRTFNLLALVLMSAFFGCMQIKACKKLHPLVWIVTGAVVGIVLQL